MAALKIDTTIRNNMMDEITAVAGANAKIKIYSGTQPAGGGTATTLLGTLTCAATFATAASGGVLVINAVTGATAAATGTASWFRLTQSDDTWVLDGDVTLQNLGGDLTLDSTSIVIGGSINLAGPNTFTASNPA